MNLNETLAKLTTTESKTWQEEALQRKENRGWLRKAAFVAVTVLGELRRRKMTQRDLAQQMGLSPQQVNKIVKGQENLTLETIDKLERALGITLMGNASYHPAKAILDFGSLPVAVKRFGGIMHGLHNQGSIISCTISLSNVIKGDMVYKQKELHTNYPNSNHKRWFEIHSAHS